MEAAAVENIFKKQLHSLQELAVQLLVRRNNVGWVFDFVHHPRSLTLAASTVLFLEMLEFSNFYFSQKIFFFLWGK
jgi:hypothetical protein